MTTDVVGSPLWSYQLGLEQGYIPTDPRQAAGVCSALGVPFGTFDGPYQPWQTGGPGAGTIAPSATRLYGDWPPTSISGFLDDEVRFLPTYTPTGVVVTLPTATFTATASDVHQGNGWFDPDDTALAPTPIAGCSYPDPWEAEFAPLPLTVCP
jgi:glucan 1,3-beta-glucosidase